MTKEIGKSAAKPLHVVQVGWDTTLLEFEAPSDSCSRQNLYAQLLEARRPGSRMTIVVLGAPRKSRRILRYGVVVQPVSGRWSSVARLPAVLARLHAEQGISVIASQSPLEEGWASLLSARGRCPVVDQVHYDMLSDEALPGGSKLRQQLGRTRRRLALRLLPLYAAVRTVAPEMAKELIARGARDVRSVSVPVLDLSKLLALPVEKRQPRVLFVGRLAPEKNLPLWLDVAQRVCSQHPEVHFDIVGDGALRPAMEARTRQLAIDDRVTFHGAKPRAALPEIYRQASVLLLTSNHEGFGRVLVEAMAAGVPIVSTRTAGAREVLGDGEAGVMAPIGDALGLAVGVVNLLTVGNVRAAMIAAGRQRVVDRFEPITLAGQWVDMLIEAAERHTARAPR